MRQFNDGELWDILGDFYEGSKLISETITGNEEWYAYYTVVFELGGVTYQFEYRKHTSPNCGDTEITSDAKPIEPMPKQLSKNDVLNALDTEIEFAKGCGMPQFVMGIIQAKKVIEKLYGETAN